MYNMSIPKQQSNFNTNLIEKPAYNVVVRMEAGRIVQKRRKVEVAKSHKNVVDSAQKSKNRIYFCDLY